VAELGGLDIEVPIGEMLVPGDFATVLRRQGALPAQWLDLGEGQTK
jgi:hypothetical protein